MLIQHFPTQKLSPGVNCEIFEIFPHFQVFQQLICNTQMYDRGFGLSGPHQVHTVYKMHTSMKYIRMLVQLGVWLQVYLHNTDTTQIHFGSTLDSGRAWPPPDLLGRDLFPSSTTGVACPGAHRSSAPWPQHWLWEQRRNDDNVMMV